MKFPFYAKITGQTQKAARGSGLAIKRNGHIEQNSACMTLHERLVGEAFT
jgi:hypothetical protein